MAEQMTGADCATVIGGDVVIKGELAVEKGLRVDGSIVGSVSSSGKVVLGKSAQLQADVRAGSLVVEGTVNGNITAERVQIEATGKVFGDVNAVKLSVAEGATFTGKLNVGPEATQTEAKDVIPAPVAARLSDLAAVGAARGNGKN